MVAGADEQGSLRDRENPRIRRAPPVGPELPAEPPPSDANGSRASPAAGASGGGGVGGEAVGASPAGVILGGSADAEVPVELGTRRHCCQLGGVRRFLSVWEVRRRSRKFRGCEAIPVSLGISREISVSFGGGLRSPRPMEGVVGGDACQGPSSGKKTNPCPVAGV